MLIRKENADMTLNNEFFQRYEACLNEMVEQAKKDGIYDSIVKECDPKDAESELFANYPEIAKKWNVE